MDECSSNSFKIDCGVPQGSILGPILISLFMLSLGNIIKRHFHLKKNKQTWELSLIHLLLVYNVLNGLRPTYLLDLLLTYEPSRPQPFNYLCV